MSERTKTYSDKEAADLLAISLRTLQRYIADGNWIQAPQKVGGRRRWTNEDIVVADDLITAVQAPALYSVFIRTGEKMRAEKMREKPN